MSTVEDELRPARRVRDYLATNPRFLELDMSGSDRREVAAKVAELVADDRAQLESVIANENEDDVATATLLALVVLELRGVVHQLEAPSSRVSFSGWIRRLKVERERRFVLRENRLRQRW